MRLAATNVVRRGVAVVVVGTLAACGGPGDGSEVGADLPATAAVSQPDSPVPTTPTSGETSTEEPTMSTPSSRPSEPVVDRDDLVPSPEPGAMPPVDVLPTPLPTAPADPATLSPDVRAVAEAAQRDLASRVDGDIEVLLARAETFPDGAVGCPRPDQVVTQAVVDGHRVLLRSGDRVWLYTAAEDGKPRLCPSDAADGGYGFVPPPGLDR